MKWVNSLFNNNFFLSFLILFLVLSSLTSGYLIHKFKLPPHQLIRNTFDALVERPSFRSLWLTMRNDVLGYDTNLGYWPEQSLPNQSSQTDGLGYLAGYESSPETSGLIIHKKNKSQSGLNLTVSGHAPEAQLMDEEGKTLHRWTKKWSSIFPNKVPHHQYGTSQTKFWRRVRAYPNGDLVAIFQGQGMVMLDRNSKILWSRFNRPINDLQIKENGNIYVITRKYHQIEWFDLNRKFYEYFLTVLTREGKIKKRISLFEAIQNSRYRNILHQPQKLSSDFLHTNTVHIISENSGDDPGSFGTGNVLLAFPKINQIAVLDIQESEIKWKLSDLFRYQHNPRLLPDGDILLFDNFGHRGNSRVIELDPRSQDINWEFPKEPNDNFRSTCCGISQRLNNGNTLITDTTSGRSFEITRSGEIVWKYVNPNSAASGNDLIAALFQVQRLPRKYFENWI